MNKKKLLLIVISLFLLRILATSQIINISPENPTIDDTITLIFNAALGNGELAGNTGDVYIYTGVITAQSTSSSDWKHVSSGWCENPISNKMTSLGNDLYEIKFHIKSFYGIPDQEMVLQIACLFVSSDCSKVGRSTDNRDIFYPLQATFSKSEFKSYGLKSDSLTLVCSDGTIIITPYSATILNIFSGVPGKENYPSFSTIAKKTDVPVSLSINNNLLKFSTDSIELIIDTTNLRFKFIYQNDTVLDAIKIYNFEQSGSIATKLKVNERIYGTGSRAIDLDRRGHQLSINNQAHYGYSLGAENLNITLPIITSSERYALFIDNHSIANLDIGSTNSDIFSYSFNGGQADVFFIAGNNYKNLTSNITYLTGNQPMPPIWSLGYIQSKFGYQNETEATNIVNNLIASDFPLDALVLDLYWFGTPSTMGNLNWDHSRFSNPETMMANFKEKGVKTILIAEPYFTLASSNYNYANALKYFGKNSSGNTYVLNGFWAGSAALLDILNPDAQDWFWQFYNNRTDEGVAGWWSDLGEPEDHPSDMLHFNGVTAPNIHNIYSLEWERLISTKWQSNFPDKRLFNLSRSGFAGMQRYSAFPWSGDISRSFEGLRAQVPIMLSMGLTGIGYMHSDVGGFTGGGNDDELFTRWVQMGVFAPIFRIHGSGIETAPTAYGSQARINTRKYIKLRYQLLPYNYTLAYENSTFGTPLARPMDFYEPHNPDLQNVNDQYFWGDEFIVAPVLFHGQNQRSVKLPKGDWIEYHSLAEFNGPGNFTISAPIQDIPVLVKAGSFIPTARNLKTTDNYRADTLFIQYFPDKNTGITEYTLFDDDKTSPNSLLTSSIKLIQFIGNYMNSEATITISSNGNGYFGMPDSRQFVFEIFRINSSPGKVTIDNTEQIKYSSLDELLRNTSGYYLDSYNQKLYVHLPFVNTTTVLHLTDFNVNSISSQDSGISNFSVYPNPGNGYLIVESAVPDLSPTSISIYSVLGALVKQLDSQSGISIRMNTGDLEKGIYFIQIKNLSGTITIKWIKE